MTKRLVAAISIVAVLALSACAGGFGQPLAYGYSTLTSINDAASESYQAGNLDRADFQDTITISGCIDSVLDTATRAWEAGQEAEANAQLAVALSLIAELQTYDGETWNGSLCGP